MLGSLYSNLTTPESQKISNELASLKAEEEKISELWKECEVTNDRPCHYAVADSKDLEARKSQLLQRYKEAIAREKSQK